MPNLFLVNDASQLAPDHTAFPLTPVLSRAQVSFAWFHVASMDGCLLDKVLAMKMIVVDTFLTTARHTGDGVDVSKLSMKVQMHATGIESPALRATVELGSGQTFVLFMRVLSRETAGRFAPRCRAHMHAVVHLSTRMRVGNFVVEMVLVDTPVPAILPFEGNTTVILNSGTRNKQAVHKKALQADFSRG